MAALFEAEVEAVAVFRGSKRDVEGSGDVLPDDATPTKAATASGADRRDETAAPAESCGTK